MNRSQTGGLILRNETGTKWLPASPLLRRAVTVTIVSMLTWSASRGEELVIADDPFTDGDFASSKRGDALGLTWLDDKKLLSVVDGKDALGDGKALHFKTSSDFGIFTAHFPMVPLAMEGDTLTVQFDYLLPTGLAKVGSGFRLGLYDSHGTLRTTMSGATACNDDSGYGMSSNAGGTGGARDSMCFREAAGNNLLGGPAPASTMSIEGSKKGPAIPADGQKHQLRIVFKRAAGGALDAAYAVDGIELASMHEGKDTLLATQFDECAVGFGGANNPGEITIDNFKASASTQQPLASMQPPPPPTPAGPVFRQWTNLQGRKIEATLISYDAGAKAVKVAMRDGREFALALATLSADDVAFVTKNAGTVPPAAASTATNAPHGWAVQFPEPQKKREAKLESGRTLLRSLRPGHPRLMMVDDDWSSLKELTGKDALARKLYATVQAAGTTMLDASPLEHVLPDGVRLLQTSRQFVARMYTLGLLHRLDGDPKWSARAVKEMINICEFKDWNPSHFLDVGEMAHGMAIGYDWFYDQLSEAQRAKVREAIVEKAFTPALLLYAKPTGWHRGSNLNNWNQVCNGGLIIAALAIAGEEKRVSQQIMEAAMTSLEPAMNLYLPDGAWDEGTGYWDYATSYVVSCSEALRTATGSDGGISNAPAFDKAAEFMQHAAGASGKSFNFADAGPSDWNRPALMWMGRHFKRPDYSSMVKSQIEKSGASERNLWFGAAHSLMWFDRGSGSSEWKQAPCDRVFRRIEMVSLRSSWEDGAWSISAKGGDNRFNHGDLDLGTFVLDAEGVRWAVDLGADSYSLDEYFGAKRFTYYRTSSKGQNTLTWDDKNQDLDGTGFVEEFDSTVTEGSAVLNLTKGYHAKHVRRGLQILRGVAPSILIQDEIAKPDRGTVSWAMHTTATVEGTGASVVLSSAGKKIKATILQPAGATFQVQEVNLEPPAYPTPDTRKLLIKVPAAGDVLTIAVRFSSVTDAKPPAALVPLAQWKVKPVPK